MSDPDPEPAPRQPPQYNREIAAGTEQMAVALWRRDFVRIQEAQEKTVGEYVQVIEDRSSLRLDDQYLGKWRTGTLHTSALGTAADALNTVQLILEPVANGTGGLPMTGLYPVLRAAIEGAALAIYLLEPKDRDERLRRSYQIAAVDAKYQGNFAALTGNAGNTIYADTKAKIRALLATRPSIEASGPFEFKEVKYSTMVEMADAAVAADPAADHRGSIPLIAWWQLLSGLSHGKSWSLVGMLERSNAVVDQANESAHVKMTSSAAGIALILQAALEALETALRLYGQRSKVTWNQPEDASEPPTMTYQELRDAARAAATESGGTDGETTSTSAPVQTGE